jgi:hypothetical protein
MPNTPYNPEPQDPASGYQQGVSNFDFAPGGLPGSLPVPPTLQNLQATPLYAWGQTIEYVGDQGLRSSPVAAPFQSALEQFWRTHAGSCWKIISCAGQAIGSNPPVPSFNTQDNNDVLMFWRMVYFTPQNLVDGQQLRGLFISWVFKLQKMPVPGVDVFDFGASPFDVTPAASNILNPQDFVQYLDKSSGVQGFQGGGIAY